MYYFSQFCRLCIRRNINLINLYCTNDDLVILGEKMRSVLPEIVYEKDNIPNFVCIECCNNVKQFYDFKKMCLKNNEILKLYASKLLSIKDSPENRNIENELKLLQKQVADENSDIDLSIIFVKCVTDENTGYKHTQSDTELSEEPVTAETVSIKEESIVTENCSVKSDFIEPYLKLECTEEDDESSFEDHTEDPGDESMDCDEVISINDTDNENGEDDLIITEPMNLTKSLNDPFCANPETVQMVLPPHLASGNRGKTRTNDKYRMVYTEHQRLELEKEYLLNRFVPDRRRAELAISLGLTVRQIKIWFQNRRAKERRETKRTDTTPQNTSTPPKTTSKLAVKPSTTPDRPRSVQSSSTDTRRSSTDNQSDDFIRKQQEYFFQQQILQQQRDILIQEQVLRQRKDFINQQEQLINKEFHQQFYQEILRQEEYIRQQKQYVTQQQQQLLRPESLLQQQAAALLIGQPMLLPTCQTTLLPTSNNQQLLLPQQTELLFSNIAELMKRKEELLKRNKKSMDVQNKDIKNKNLLPNLEELYRRKQELMKRNEERMKKE